MPTAAEPDPREAIAARREQIADEPRPRPLYVMGQQPPPSAEQQIYRLYRPEWVIVYTAAATGAAHPGEDLVQACTEHFRLRYLGRVRDSEVLIDLDDPATPSMARLKLCLPTMKGEFKHAVPAYEFAQQQGWTVFTVVERNSNADHNLRAYGTKKLPQA